MHSVALLYIVGCLLYVYFFLYRRKKMWLVKLLIVIFFPFLGFIIVFLMDQREHSRKPNVQLGIKQNQRLVNHEISIVKESMEKERNVIPIEDALILNETKVKRKMLLDLLKEESFQNMEALRMALENEDTETSHYAAAAIMEIKRKLLNSIQSLELQADEHPSDITVLTSYSEVLKMYIECGFLDESTLKKYTYSYSNLLDRMIELDPNEEVYFIGKINSDLALKEYEKARLYGDLFLNLHPTCEEAYFLDMKINYCLKNKEAFKKSIARLRGSSVKLSPSGLSKLRFWLQGDLK